ncbi:unnamed protein product, partial [marine sediment metagenome]
GEIIAVRKENKITSAHVRYENKFTRLEALPELFVYKQRLKAIAIPR